MTTEKKYGRAEMEKEYGPMTFGRALWAHRKCEEITQKDFAQMLSISPSSLCDLEKEKKLPSVNRAAKIAQILNEPEKIWIRLALQERKINMAWIETLTKEAFHAAIREAMKPQIDQISDRLQSFEQRLSRLEGAVEGSTKANEANIRAYEATVRGLFFEFKADFLQRQLDTATSQKNGHKH